MRRYGSLINIIPSGSTITLRMLLVLVLTHGNVAHGLHACELLGEEQLVFVFGPATAEEELA